MTANPDELFLKIGIRKYFQKQKKTPRGIIIKNIFYFLQKCIKKQKIRKLYSSFAACFGAVSAIPLRKPAGTQLKVHAYRLECGKTTKIL